VGDIVVSGLFGDVGRVKIPHLEFSDLQMPDLQDYSTEMAQAAMEARLADLTHALKEVADHSNRLAGILEGAQSDDINVERDYASGASNWEIPETRYEELASGGLDLSKVAFGYVISGQTFTVKTGSVQRGTTQYDVPEKNVNITGGDEDNPQFVYMRCELDDITTAVVLGQPVATRPVTNSNYFQMPLYSVYWDGSVIVLLKIHHIGDILIPALLQQ
jgi:hypothetical protein